MYDDIAGLQFTLETDGFDRFEAACVRDEQSAREFLVGQHGITEMFVLQTCQRYELYVSGSRASEVLTDLLEKIGLDAENTDRLLQGDAVVDHLFHVACGLESGVLGEDEILGQLRDAYSRAIENDTLGDTLGHVVLKALRVGERARTETSINEGSVSLGSITVQRARRELNSLSEEPTTLDDATVLVIGAGDVASQVVKALVNRSDPERLTVANRSPERAAMLLETLDGEAIALEELTDELLGETDVLISATGSPDRVVRAGDLQGHSLVAIDLANPRDIAVDVEGTVRLVRIDDVLSTQNDGLRRRQQAIPAVEEIISDEREHLVEQLRIEEVDDTLGELYSNAHELREAELEQAQTRLAESGEPLSDSQAAVVREFSESLLHKLLHPKANALREAAASDETETVEAWLELFEEASTGVAIRESHQGTTDDESVNQPLKE